MFEWFPPGAAAYRDHAKEKLLAELSHYGNPRDAQRAGPGRKPETVGEGAAALERSYGPLAFASGVEGWLALAAIVRTHLELYRVLDENGPKDFERELKNKRHELAVRVSVDDDELKRRENYARTRYKPLQSRFELNEAVPVHIVERPMLSNLNSVEVEVLNSLEIFLADLEQAEKLIADKGQKHTMRTAVASILYERFGALVYYRRYGLRLYSGVIRVECPVDVYIWVALSELWSSDNRVMSCASDECRAPFPRKHGSLKYCVKGCATKAWRKNTQTLKN